MVALQFNTRVFTCIAFFVASTLISGGCGQGPTNTPDARELCLSTQPSDFQNLNFALATLPVADDDFSNPLPRNPVTASGDFETGYSRVFHAEEAIPVNGTSIVLPRGFPLWNAVRVYDSVEKAREAIATMDPPRFVLHTPTGHAGVEMDVSAVGDRSQAWYYAREVVDADNGMSTTEVDAQIRFRTGNTVSDIGVVTWYADPDMTGTFLLDLARVSELKIADSIYAS